MLGVDSERFGQKRAEKTYGWVDVFSDILTVAIFTFMILVLTS